MKRFKSDLQCPQYLYALLSEKCGESTLNPSIYAGLEVKRLFLFVLVFVAFFDFFAVPVELIYTIKVLQKFFFSLI